MGSGIAAPTLLRLTSGAIPHGDAYALLRQTPARRRPVRPRLRPCAALAEHASLAERTKALALYLAQTEVHTYAFSVAANVILSLFPFIVLMLTLARQVFHSPAMVAVIADEIRYFLPAGQDFVIRNMTILSRSHGGVQIASVVMLLISSTGVFMPLEVALNQVWGAGKNRSYVMNQLVSLALAFAIGTLTLTSIALTAAQHSLLSFFFLGNTDNIVFNFLAHWLLQISAAVISVLIFLLIYWVLPNRRLPIEAVVPAAVTTGLAVGGRQAHLHRGAALARLPFRLRPVLRLRLAHDVGLRQRTSDARRRSLLGLATCSAARPRDRPQPRQQRASRYLTCSRASPLHSP